MYKSAHDIPVYHFTQCELGKLSYMGLGLLRKKRFKKIKAELSDLTKPDQGLIDKAVKFNWISTMELLDRAIRASAFATPEQKERLNAVAYKLGMSLDPDKNKKILDAYRDWVLESVATEGAEDKKEKKSPLHLLTGHLAFISLVLGWGWIDPKKISVAAFLDLSEMANDKMAREKEGGNDGR